MKKIGRWLLPFIIVALLLSNVYIANIQSIQNMNNFVFQYPFLFPVLSSMNCILSGIAVGLLVSAKSDYANKFISLTVASFLILALPWLYFFVQGLPLPGFTPLLFKTHEITGLIFGLFFVMSIKAKRKRPDISLQPLDVSILHEENHKISDGE